MALDKSSLTTRILAELEDKGFNTTSSGRDEVGWMPKFAEAIASAVVDEIQTNARAVGTDSNSDTHSLSVE